jgi:hypothetical protein
VTEKELFGLTPGHEAVWRYNDGFGGGGSGIGNWDQVGGAAADLFGGYYGLFATSPDSGDIFRFLQGEWLRIGAPGASFVATAESIYGLGDAGNVWRYDGTGDTWTQVGGPASELYAGVWGLVATNPSDHQLYRYLGQPFQWEPIGGPGAVFAVTHDTVFGLTPDKSAVYRYDGAPNAWTVVGGPADEICAFQEH